MKEKVTLSQVLNCDHVGRVWQNCVHQSEQILRQAFSIFRELVLVNRSWSLWVKVYSKFKFAFEVNYACSRKKLFELSLEVELNVFVLLVSWPIKKSLLASLSQPLKKSRSCPFKRSRSWSFKKRSRSWPFKRSRSWSLEVEVNSFSLHFCDHLCNL